MPDAITVVGVSRIFTPTDSSVVATVNLLLFKYVILSIKGEGSPFTLLRKSIFRFGTISTSRGDPILIYGILSTDVTRRDAIWELNLMSFCTF